MVLQRFAEDFLIVSDLVYLDDAPKGEDGRPRKEGTLEMVRRAVWGMLYADDARVVSTSPRRLIRMIGVWVLGRGLKLTREHLAVAPCRRLTQFLYH